MDVKEIKVETSDEGKCMKTPVKMMFSPPRMKPPSIDDFFLDEVLATGSFGEVRHGWTLSLEREVVVKSLDRKAIKENDLEVQLLHQLFMFSLPDNPFIIKLLSYFFDDQCVYLVFDYAEHGSLYDLLLREKSKCLPEKQAARYLSHVAQGLDYLHTSRGYLHGNLKPEHVLVDGLNVAKLAGFDNCWPAPLAYGRRDVAGTLEYLAPELLLGQPYDETIDYWAFGVLLYELLSGKTPFLNSSKKITRKNILDMKMNKVPRNIAPDALYLFEHILVCDPKRRLCPLKALKWNWFRRCLNWKK